MLRYEIFRPGEPGIYRHPHRNPVKPAATLAYKTFAVEAYPIVFCFHLNNTVAGS